METHFKICASCLQEDENVSSSEWCWNCMEGLCTECAKYHRKQKPSRQHKIVVLNNIPNFDVLLSYIHTSCPMHNNQPLLSFCSTHRDLCCELCVKTSHGDCKQVITLTEAAATTTNDDVAEKFKSLEKLLEIKTETIRKSLVSQGEEVVQKVQQMRTEIDKYFDKLEEEVKKNLIVQHESYLKLVHQENSSVEECFHEIKNMKELMCVLSDDIPSNQIPCQKINEIIYDRKSSEKLKETSVTGDQNSQNDRKKSTEVKAERIPEKASLTHKLQLSKLGSNVTSTECCYLPDGKLVLIDTTGKCVMSCNDTGTQLKKVSLKQEPLDISVYDKTRLIVALGNDGIQSLNIVSLRPLGKVINLGGKCTAVTHDHEKVIVAVDDKLKLITIDGKLIRHIDHPGLVWSLSAVFNGKIYYSDFSDDDDVLHCITLDGTNIFSYKHPQLIGPTGVAVDTHGNVYVAGLSSNNVHQLSRDGTLLSIILTKTEDGIKYPRGMAYNREKRELLLINQDRKIIQFYAIH
ncbi:unnamed protein product [Mytilus edulis]|uniref:B box-type domain-containing protein n=1 Tax=Mytilus edulis TaxID=6550 RepID=A0A8S3THG1_MYTED|nr:unnamed protein product [Mytilus edulis]